jgi:hypothetical protein
LGYTFFFFWADVYSQKGTGRRSEGLMNATSYSESDAFPLILRCITLSSFIVGFSLSRLYLRHIGHRIMILFHPVPRFPLEVSFRFPPSRRLIKNG